MILIERQLRCEGIIIVANVAILYHSQWENRINLEQYSRSSYVTTKSMLVIIILVQLFYLENDDFSSLTFCMNLYTSQEGLPIYLKFTFIVKYKISYKILLTWILNS